MSRIDKINQQLKKEISQILLFEVKDSLIGFITITHVSLSPDLKNAKVYYTILGDEAKRIKAQKGLDRAVGYIRKQVAQRIKMKFVPEIRFYFDEILQESLRVEKLLDELKDEDRRENKE